MTSRPLNQSSFELPAKEVLRLAKICEGEILAARKRQLNQALTDLRERRTSYFFGLYTAPTYPTPESAMRSEEVAFAKNFLHGSLRTAQTLIKAATALLDNPNISDENKVIRLTTADYFELI